MVFCGPQYAGEAEALATAFNKNLYDASSSSYSTTYGHQSANALPLYAKIVDSSASAQVFESLVNYVVNGEPNGASYPMHLSTGIFGLAALVWSLVDGGRQDLALEIVRTPSYPSLGYMAAQGNNGTTLWETWEGVLAPANMSEGASRNHIMFGTAFPWMVQNVAGLSRGTVFTYEAPACRPQAYFVYGPYGNGSGYSVNTPVRYGYAQLQPMFREPTSCAWTSYGSSVAVNATFPFVPAASVCVPLPPGPPSGSISESGVQVWTAVGGCVQSVDQGISSCYVDSYSFTTQAETFTGSRVCFEVGSGSYAFEAGPQQLSITCATAPFGSPLVVNCSQSTSSPTATIVDVHFASYGRPTGNCGSYDISQCHSSSTRSVVESACIGSAACSLNVTTEVFGAPEPCQQSFLRPTDVWATVQVLCAA
jgi:Bacterial alpha-L-rhamnosidase 6 hairpin glycosidase domain/Galactose binding lectin domain